MTIDRSLWIDECDPNYLPAYPCPACKNGRLKLQKDSLREVETGQSKRHQADESWEPDWVEARFSLIMECSSAVCGEIVVVSGYTKELPMDDPDFGWSYQHFLLPKSFLPAPPIIISPDNTPTTVTNELEQAFLLFWVDRNASANRIRASVEALLTEMKVARFTRSNGQLRPLSLNNRIAKFEKAEADMKDTLHALRIVGNLGSHESDVSVVVLLDAFELYESVLDSLYSNKAARLKSLKSKIKRSKGRYK